MMRLAMLVIRILPLTNLLLPVAIAHHAVALSATARDVCSKGCSLGEPFLAG